MTALLFLDVDGPLIPFGRVGGYPEYGVAPPLGWANPLLARLNPAYGPRLAALPCDLVWATTWMSDANTCVAPVLGLPSLPVVEWLEQEASDAWEGLHWKTRTLHEWAAGRPYAWVDDEITAADHAWVAARCGERALLHHVSPQDGLTDADFDVLRSWLGERSRHESGH